MSDVKMVKSVACQIVCGVFEGYGSHTAKEIDMVAVAETIKNLATKVMDETGIYVSGTMLQAKTLYHNDWGCPLGGESTFVFCGSANPQFTNVEQYRNAVLKLASLMKKEFQQSTLTVEFKEIELAYLTD